MKRKAYPIDLSDTERLILEPLIPPAKPGGRPREVEMREIVNGIFYILRGGSWRMMPHDLPAWQTVYGYFGAWRDQGSWQAMHDALRAAVRQQAGRQTEPSAALLDSQRVKTTETTQEAAYDKAKNVKGRKRHRLVDVMGLILVVLVHCASIPERQGAKALLRRAQQQGFARLQLIWADGGYSGHPFANWVARASKSSRAARTRSALRS